MADTGLGPPFLGALQACVSVLLTMCYGVAARRLHLIHDATINDMSGLTVKLFLPALIIVNLGQQLHLGTALNYAPVIIWSIIYTSASIGLTHLISRVFALPQWVTPACSFNNTSSLPLLLLQSLSSVGSLRLILPDKEDISDEIERAQSYFLVCAVVSKTIAYVVGPKMLEDRGDMNTPFAGPGEQHRFEEDEQLTENTSLLPQRAQKARHAAKNCIHWLTQWLGSFVPHRVRQELMAPFGSPFADVAICCTMLGALLGLVPALHRAFFAQSEDGGIFQAWLTTSVRNIGRLFTTLQIFMVGCKLGVTLEHMVTERNSGPTPMRAISTIFLVRLVVWPALSIPVIYGLAKHTELLGKDPMLWFSMMLMPAGPPALLISGLAELAQASESEKMAIAKTLMVGIHPTALPNIMELCSLNLDHVCAFSLDMFYHHGRSEGIGGCTRWLTI
ncbi:uncharacterized protein N7459_002462 [Penicillium hispanicum]|uniref:uncharacterized protein n=1 Tax=Penicillium hispanicum TaxID=1080232 RepID=UPI00254113FD|nr:uncharacterized protein N7459_002462 [Penicillium hispanicum]KAJ5586697.1 hypothetical protein N7459_002462 [Penicillium hispanicum]